MALTLAQASLMTAAVAELQVLYIKAAAVVKSTGKGTSSLASASSTIDKLQTTIKERVASGATSFAVWADVAKACRQQLADLSLSELGVWGLSDSLDRAADDLGDALKPLAPALTDFKTIAIAIAVIAGAVAVVYLVSEARAFRQMLPSFKGGAA